MLYRRQLDMDMEELKPDLAILRSAAEELRTSARFPQLLQAVLAIGNALNASTFRGGAGGFSLQSLSKVRLQTQCFHPLRLIVITRAQLQYLRSGSSTTGSPTLLHYLVRIVLREDPSLLAFLDDAPHVDAASRRGSCIILVRVAVLTLRHSQSRQRP